MKPKKPVLTAIGILFLLAAGILLAAWSRFHFPYGSAPFLARLQQTATTRSAKEPDSRQTLKIIGHRGSGIPSTANPETRIGNTKTAIHAAIRAQADWIEIDVRKTRDGELVVFHDERIDRKTSGSGKVSELNLADLKRFDLLVESHPSDQPEKILTLDEFYREFGKKHRRWVFDVKESGIEGKLLPWVRPRLTDREVIFFGEYDVLKAYKECGYPLGYTATWKNRENRMRILFHPKGIIRRGEELGCHYLVLPAIFSTKPLAKAVTSRGMEVWIYGSENTRDWEHAARIGATGLIVDDPGKTMKFVREDAIHPESP